ncbi:MAG: 2-hydroxyacyl-CoA dehydratase family protein [bacterium]
MEKLDTESFISGWRRQADHMAGFRQETGRPVMGLVLTDVPEELVYAAGAVPTTLLARDVSFQAADKHLQGFACSYSRSLVERVEQGELDFLDGLIIPYACDTTRCLDLIFKYMDRFGFYDCLRIPKRVNARGMEKYFRAELQRLSSALSSFTGVEVTDARLQEAISSYNRVRGLLQRLREGVREGRIPASKYLSAVKSAMVLPPEQSAGPLESLAEESALQSSEEKGRRVIVGGKMAEPPGLLDLLSGSGLFVVEDHLTVGGRWAASLVPEDGDPWDALIKRQSQRLPFSGIWDGRPSRASHLVERARELKADGVVYLVQKFCEPSEIDYPGIRRELEREGLPVLELETDLGESSLENVRTRVDAFAEMLQ